jgi:hypothetical protein
MRLWLRLVVVGALAALALAAVALSAPAGAKTGAKTAARAAAKTAANTAAKPAARAAASQSSLFFFGGSSSGRLVQIPVAFDGRLIVRFHGDPATGCAVHGLCGYSGTVLWTPPARGGVDIFESTAHRLTSYQISLSLFSPASSPSVPGGLANAIIQGPGQSCGDAARTGANINLALSRGRVRFNLAQASPSLLQTRCAGPLDADVASALPSPTATINSTLHGEMTVDLVASGSFAAHGFAGTVVSTLKLALGRPGRPQRSGSTPPPVPTERYRLVRVSYRAAISGTVIAAVSGDADTGLCGPLGACGLHGTLSLRPAVSGVQADFYAQAPASRPYRDLLTALGISTAGRASGVSVGGEASWNNGGTVAAVLSDGTGSCRDATDLNGGAITFESAGRRLGAQYIPSLNGDSTLRTRCPGPESTQLPLALGTTLPTALGGRRPTISLRAGGPFLDDGYTGLVKSNLRITLTRRRVHTSVINLPGG